MRRRLRARRTDPFITSAIAAAIPADSGLDLRPLGPVRFRNILDPVEIFEICGPPKDEEVAIDPVCRMQVKPATAPAKLLYGAVTYFFCSFDCARGFAASPEKYLV